MVQIRKQSFWRRAGEKCQGTAVGLADRRQGHALCPVLCAQAAERPEGGQWQRNRMEAQETGNLYQIPAAYPSKHHGKLD